MVYPVTNTGAQATISAVEKRTHSLKFPQSFVHGRSTAFINTVLINWTKELWISLRPKTAHSPWINGKIETQKQHIVRFSRNFRTTLDSIGLPQHRNSLLPAIQVSTTQLEGHPMKLFSEQNLRFRCLRNLNSKAINTNCAGLNSAKTYHLTHTVRTIWRISY